MDTEDYALTHKPATLQSNTYHQSQVHYLKKIQQLCSIIFTSQNYIYSWGSALQELSKFQPFQLFNTNITIIETDIQYLYDRHEKQSLQMTIKYEFQEYLNKIATLDEWVCGIDLMLGTYLPLGVVGRERTYRLHEEKKYRSILHEYATNDVFAVAKLAYKMNLIKFTTLPSTIQYEAISDDEDELQMQSELSINIEPQYNELIVHVTDELEENELLQQPHQQISIINPMKNFHDILGIDENYPANVHFELHYHIASSMPRNILNIERNNDMDLQSLPEIMKLHYSHEPDHLSMTQHQAQQLSSRTMTVRIVDEPQVSNFNHLGSTTETTSTLTLKQIRNRTINCRHRANRYRYEVIRDVYKHFNIRKIKRILKSMDIYYVNINMVRHTLFIGLKNQKIVDEVKTLLHDRLLTERHYRRLYRIVSTTTNGDFPFVRIKEKGLACILLTTNPENFWQMPSSSSVNDLKEEVLFLHYETFYSLVKGNCGDIVLEIMQAQHISSVDFLLDVSNIFIFLELDSNELLPFKKTYNLFSRSSLHQKITSRKDTLILIALVIISIRKKTILAFCAEDSTVTVSKVTYDTQTNTFIDFSLPLGQHGLPIIKSYSTDSFTCLENCYSNKPMAKSQVAHLIQPLSYSLENISPYLLAKYGTNNKFKAPYVISRWGYIYRQCKAKGVRIIGYSKDSNSRYLNAMRRSLGVFGDFVYNNRPDYYEINIPNTWNWLLVQSKQLFICMQEPHAYL
ncbi:unnamed protein product [Rotaria socialis]